MKNLNLDEVTQVAGGARYLYITTEIHADDVSPACVKTLAQSINEYHNNEISEVDYHLAVLFKCNLEALHLLDARRKTAIPTSVVYA